MPAYILQFNTHSLPDYSSPCETLQHFSASLSRTNSAWLRPTCFACRLAVTSAFSPWPRVQPATSFGLSACSVSLLVLFELLLSLTSPPAKPLSCPQASCFSCLLRPCLVVLHSDSYNRHYSCLVCSDLLNHPFNKTQHELKSCPVRTGPRWSDWLVFSLLCSLIWPAGGTPTRLALYLPNTSAILIWTASAFCPKHAYACCSETPAWVCMLLFCTGAGLPLRLSRMNRGWLMTIYRTLLSYLATGRRWKQGNYEVGVDGWVGGVVILAETWIQNWELIFTFSLRNP